MTAKNQERFSKVATDKLNDNEMTLLPPRGIYLKNHCNTHLYLHRISLSPQPCTIVLAWGTNPLLGFQCLECSSVWHMNYWLSSCCKIGKKHVMITRNMWNIKEKKSTKSSNEQKG